MWQAPRGEKVNRVARLLSQIDPEQLNWEVVKELRSQVGDVIAQSPGRRGCDFWCSQAHL